MRKLKIIEHISLDGVIQVSGEGGDFPYGDWTAPYQGRHGNVALTPFCSCSHELQTGFSG